MAQPDSHRLRYEQWVRAYAPAMYRYAYRLTGRRQIAEDLIQETFMEAWRCIAKQEGDERARGWLFQILRHRCAHYFRDSRRRQQAGSLPDNADHHPADSSRPPLEKLAEQDSLQLAMNTLSESIRTTFLMVFMEGRTCREVAEILHIPLGTVLSRLDSGRKGLRAALARISPPGPDEPARGTPRGTTL